MNEPVPKSPCISVCVLNDQDVCTGCYRSVDEITEWMMASPEKKREIIARARERMLAMQKITLK